MKIYSFEKLIVWQKSRKLAVILNKATRDFPKDEIFGMISQMRRCSISIASNIAEGSGRHTAKDKARFTEIIELEYEKTLLERELEIKKASYDSYFSEEETKEKQV